MNRQIDFLLPLLCGTVIALVIALWYIPATRPHLPGSSDIIIFAPHPDDAVLCCAGVIQQAHDAGKSVLVVNVTNGDDYKSAAAVLLNKPVDRLKPQDMVNLGRTRQIEELHALGTLGVSPDRVVFLGYPDGALDEIMKHELEPYLHWNTLKNATYGLRKADYHTNRYGKPAWYMRGTVVDDVADIISRMNPSEMYVTSAYDAALDHNATYWMVFEAIKQTKYDGKLSTYIIHSPTPDQPTPTTPQTIVTLTSDQVKKKQDAISVYHSQLAPNDFPLMEFAKNEETFW